ncbi:MAG TPA: class I SAM-dependent methyltransferase [Candidatus Saccharimonadales bacterium]|nr:class I SAM-dependent methyltransferase [Candidatus Saccharimonadales bacterium]
MSSAGNVVDFGSESDQQRLEKFVHRIVEDLGAALSAALVLVGDQLGLYKAMDRAGRPLGASELASMTATDERYVREWLSAQAASGYVQYHASSGQFSLSPEQAMTLAREDSPVYMPGAFQIVSAVIKDEHKVTEAFRSGVGVGWHEHHPALFEGTERFFRPNYATNLISNWIPALDGMMAKLKKGAKVADVGCGYGASTILMAEAFPKSKFTGFDYHQASIERARERAKKAGVGERAAFQVSTAKEFSGTYDLITFFDCLHDMGDPVGAARHVLQALAPDGVWMIVEPFANDDLQDNLNPVGRVFYAASTMICTPASKAQEVGLALGAQSGEKRMTEVVKSAGFGSFRRAAQTPFNLVYEAKR